MLCAIVASPTPKFGNMVYRFGPYEADLRQCELRKFGIRISLERKAWHLLLTLLERPGELVTRAELERRLWGDGVFVDFEHGVNVAVKKVRAALCDSAESPTYVETVAGEGYRFIATVTHIEGAELVQEASALSAPTFPVASPSPVEKPRRSPRLWRWLAIAGVALLTVAIPLSWKVFYRPAPLFHESGWALIGDFENRTGQSLLDGTLEYAVERELSNSQFVKVVPRDRVGDVLRLMKKPLDSRIDRQLGREVCLRDGEIHALITGRIEKLGTTYVLSAEIVNPISDVVVASFSEEDQQDANLAAAVRSLSVRVRQSLGENPRLVRESLQKLEKVTTPSLHALQLYSEADRLIASHGSSKAIPVLEQTIREDPDFASAHLLLAYAYYNTAQKDKALPYFLRAVQLADGVPDRERLFIIASYAEALEQDDKAIEAYEALVRLYPDHYWATNNLFYLYIKHQRFGFDSAVQYDEAATLADRLLELRPFEVRLAVRRAQAMTNPLEWVRNQSEDEAYHRTLDRAHAYAVHTLALLQLHPEGVTPLDMCLLRLVLARQAWELQNETEAHSQFDLALAQHRPGDGLDRNLAGFAASLGKLQEAQHLLAEGPEPDVIGEAALAFYRGDLEQAKQYLGQVPEELPEWRTEGVVPLMIRVGMIREANKRGQELIQHIREQPDERDVLTVKGMLELAAGKTNEGATVLLPVLHNLSGGSSAALAYEALADAYQKQHKVTDMLRVLQEGAAYKGISINFGAAYRMRLKLELADLYRELGRTSDAEKVEADLRKELAFADPDHPILVALQHRQQSATSAQK